MSTLHPLIAYLRNAMATLLARRPPAPSGRPTAEPTLGAFGLLASQGEPHRR